MSVHRRAPEHRCAPKRKREMPPAYRVAEAVGVGVARRLTGPILIVRASIVPSPVFKYDPLTSSFCLMSSIVMVSPSLVIDVASVILKLRDSRLPEIVNVFAFLSTPEIIP